MFKYFVRRLRYGFAGKSMMVMKACISAVVLGIVLFIFFSGAFSQKQLFFNLFKTFYNTAEDMGEQIDNGDTGPFTITDEGIYFKGHENGNKIDINGKSENDEANQGEVGSQDEAGQDESETENETTENTEDTQDESSNK